MKLSNTPDAGKVRRKYRVMGERITPRGMKSSATLEPPFLTSTNPGSIKATFAVALASGALLWLRATAVLLLYLPVAALYALAP